MFRNLKANEIEIRVGMTKDSGLGLLLYKDARADMIILDETVGPLNWKREHVRDNANCIVSIYNEALSEWVSKEDTGSESNTEAQKGLASDSFKRACVNWGIGRELYTSPFIWVKGYNKYEKFTVSEIAYVNDVISQLLILDSKGKKAYSYGGGYNNTHTQEKPVREQNTYVPEQPERQESVRRVAADTSNQQVDAVLDGMNNTPNTPEQDVPECAWADHDWEPQFYDGNPWLSKAQDKQKHVCTICGASRYFNVQE